MFASLIITLRETLEAALIVGILLAYLNKTLNQKHKKFVWYGVLGGIFISLVLAFIFNNYLGGFEGRSEQIYEGVTMFIAAGLLTWMILWMLKQRHSIKRDLENKAESHIKKDHYWGLFFLSFVGVAREGIETVIFLQAAALQSGGNVMWGALLGIVIAVIVSYLLFKGLAKVPLKKFFTVTSILLILFAAGLVAHGLHEFEEAGIIPIYIEHLFDVNGVIDENGNFGSILKGLFGYNGNPSLLEVLSYWVYIVAIAGLWVKIDVKESRKV